MKMLTTDDLTAAFKVYYTEMERCEEAGCYWALLHLVLVLPDICARLESTDSTDVGKRYTRWCSQYLPSNASLTPDDRYQIRNAVLHEGSTLPNKSQYRSISFVEPGATRGEVHLNVSPDGDNLTLDVRQMAQEVRRGLDNWFASLQQDRTRNDLVERNLPRLARLQMKESHLPVTTRIGEKIENVMTSDGTPVIAVYRHPTTSSTGDH
jgi:hypothetical protein